MVRVAGNNLVGKWRLEFFGNTDKILGELAIALNVVTHFLTRAQINVQIEICQEWITLIENEPDFFKWEAICDESSIIKEFLDGKNPYYPPSSYSPETSHLTICFLP